MTTNPYLAAFSKHYRKLSIALPANALYPTFVGKALFNDPTLNSEFLAATTDINKTTVLLNSMKNGLQIGVVDVFQKFLEAMNEYAQEHNDPVVKKLVDDINQDLFSDLPSTSSLPSGMSTASYTMYC